MTDYEDRREQRRSPRHGQHQSRGCHSSGPIGRVVRGCKEATGLGHGAVITLFVLGFIFMPLLTTIVFLAMLYWTSYPQAAKRNVDRFTHNMKRAGERLGEATFGGPRHRRSTTQPNFNDAREHRRAPEQNDARHSSSTEAPRPAELREKFATLERRTNAIEEFVASEEYRLEREFEKMDKDTGNSR